MQKKVSELQKFSRGNHLISYELGCSKIEYKKDVG